MTNPSTTAAVKLGGIILQALSMPPTQSTTDWLIAEIASYSPQLQVLAMTVVLRSNANPLAFERFQSDGFRAWAARHRGMWHE